MAPAGRKATSKTGTSSKVKKSHYLLKRPEKFAGKGRKARGSFGSLDPEAVLRCTAKVSSCALLLSARCIACHGEMVRDVVGKVMEDGRQYKMADLKYDMKGGRLEALKPGSSAGEIPKGKPRADAPLAGKHMPAASLDEFFKFLQCQLRMEIREHTGTKLELADTKAEEMWPDTETFITPNLGLTERWVPYHTVLGVHELFLVEEIHSRKSWSEYKRFVAMFIFRAHCKRDLFRQAQLPLMLKESFWKDPKAAFEPGGPMEKSILAYRKKTGAPLITSCFRIIPPRVLKDDTQNLVRSVTDRTMNLIDVAEKAWSVLHDKKKTAVQRITNISNMIMQTPSCGDTWAKMLTVCIDLAYPKAQFLEQQCDVGTGAAPPLRCLLDGSETGDRAKDLKSLLKLVNASKSAHAKQFWACLEKAEGIIRKKFKALPLVCAQAATKKHAMTACTLQVQLCEYRQFRHSIARLKYGMPDDETMRGVEEPKTTSLRCENFVELNDKKKCVEFDIPVDDCKVHFEVPLKAVDNRKMVAARVAALCFNKIRDGMSKKEAEKFRDMVLGSYYAGEDVSDDSGAWYDCNITLNHANPLCSFEYEDKAGKKVCFQTTQGAAGGSILEAERIARLCWAKFEKGMKKDDVIKYRNSLYQKCAANGEPPAKRART